MSGFYSFCISCVYKKDYTLKNLFVFCLIFIVLGCGKDTKEATCTADDWVGVYSGTATCAGKTETGSLTVTKTSYPDSINVYNGFSRRNVAFQGCVVSVKEDTPLLSVPVVGQATLKGKEVHLDGKVFGIILCSTVLVKQ
jgi:hypothetical protein